MFVGQYAFKFFFHVIQRIEAGLIRQQQPLGYPHRMIQRLQTTLTTQLTIAADADRKVRSPLLVSTALHGIFQRSARIVEQILQTQKPDNRYFTADFPGISCEIQAIYKRPCIHEARMIYFSLLPVKNHEGILLNSQLLVLASSSPYRSELLKKLRIPFYTAAPCVDETALPGETARDTSLRLAQLKAHAVATTYPEALIIGSDQVALLEGRQLGKPLTHDNAVVQLSDMRGKTTFFYTALVLLNSKTGHMQSHVAENRVTLRHLSDAEIEGYLRKEQPYHCAGSAKCEGLGIALISSMLGDDPNALIGLPLIALCEMLKRENVVLF